MKIPAIALTDFRSYGHAQFTFDSPVTFVIGRNGAGKSSLIDAILWALTGHCRGTDARGSGGDKLIRENTTDPAATCVHLKIADADEQPIAVQRFQTPASSRLLVNGEGGPKDVVTAKLFDALGVTPAIVEACLQTDAFLALHHGDAKKLLLDSLEVRVPVGDEALTLDQIEARYKTWFETRRDRKAALAAIKVPPAPEGDVPDVAALEAQLTGLRESEKQHLSSASEASGRRGEIAKQLTHVQTAIARTRQLLDATRAALGLQGAKVDLAEAVLEVEDRMSKIIDEDADERADQQRLALVDAQGRLRMLEETHLALAQHSPDHGCVLNSAIPCKTPAKAFVAELATLQAQIDGLKATQDEATKAIEQARLRAADHTRLSTRLQQLKSIVEQRERQADDLETLTATEARLRTEREACPVDAAVSPELVTLQARIAKGEQVIASARDVVRQAADHARLKADQQKAARALAEAEKHVEDLGPNGLRVQALTQAVGTFEAAINESLERFGYGLEFEIDPWVVKVNGLSAELLSTSERLRVGIALQLALAEATGFGFVAIDQVDLLDSANRAVLGEVLSLRGHVQVLAAATRDDDWQPPAIPGWAWYRVQKVDDVTQVERCGEAVPV